MILLRWFRTPLRMIPNVIFLIMVLVMPIWAEAQSDASAQITSANVAELKLSFMAEACGIFTSDGRLMVAKTDGRDSRILVYDMTGGVLQFSLSVGHNSKALVSPDGMWLAVSGDGNTDGVYNLRTGERLLSWGSNMAFSPDSRFVAGLGVYDLKNGKYLFVKSGRYPLFSPDGRWLAVSGDAVYEVATGHLRFELPVLHRTTDIIPALLFSPDSSLLVVVGIGVYDLETGKPRFDISPTSFDALNINATFSPNGSLLAVGNDGVYEVRTGQRRFAISGLITPNAFSRDSSELITIPSFLATENRIISVYDVTTGTPQFQVAGYYAILSPDGSLLAGDNGMYDMKTGKRLYRLRNGVIDFSPEGSLFLAYGGLYDSKTGKRRFLVPFPSTGLGFSSDSRFVTAQFYSYTAAPVCGVFSIGEANSRGIIAVPQNVNIRRSPNPNASVVKATTEAENDYAYARSADNRWYRVGDGQWVSAHVVRVVYMPDNLPVE